MGPFLPVIYGLCLSSPAKTSTVRLKSTLQEQPTTVAPLQDVEEIHGWLVRPAEECDKEKASKIIREAFHEKCREDYDPKTLRVAANMISIPQEGLLRSGTWYVAEHPESGDIVGCGGWRFKESKGKAEVEQFASDPSYSKAKIGSALWEKTQKEVEQTMGPDADMEVISTLTAQPFYQKMGFETIKHVEVPILLEKLPCVVMRRKAVLN